MHLSFGQLRNILQLGTKKVWNQLESHIQKICNVNTFKQLIDGLINGIEQGSFAFFSVNFGKENVYLISQLWVLKLLWTSSEGRPLRLPYGHSL